jgi:DNA-binding NarL/FixJ family response regulator
MSEKIKIVLTDDHPLHLEGLALVLAKQKDFDVRARFTNSSELLAYTEKNSFDILLLDLHMPGEDGMKGQKNFSKKTIPQKLFYSPCSAEADLCTRPKSLV